MTDQNDLRERPQSAVTQRLDDLARHKRVRLYRDQFGGRMVARSTSNAIEVEGCVSRLRQLSHIGIFFRAQREVPVEVAAGGSVDEQVHYVFVVRFVTKPAEHFIVGRLSFRNRDRQPRLLADQVWVGSRRLS